MFDAISDGIILTDKDTSERLIFNYKSFLWLIYGMMTHYLRFKPEIALEKINRWVFTDLTYDKVALLGHELDYDWAMLIAYGHDYSHQGYNPEPPEDYFEWCHAYLSKHHLKQECIKYLD